MLRALVVAVGLVLAWSSPAHAGKVPIVIVSGDDIEHLRDLDPAQAAQHGYRKLGYHYERVGVFWLDVWRWDGEFVVYEHDTYAPISDDDAAALGASVPWRYRLPEGLIIIAALIELAIIGRKKRSIKTAMVAGSILVVLAGAFVLMGLTWEFAIPLLLGLHHLLTGYSRLKTLREQTALAAASQPHMRVADIDAAASGVLRASQSASQSASPSGSHRASPSASQSGAMRARPSQSMAVPSRPSQPIVVERPTTEPGAPLRKDDSVDGPKLLR